MCTGFKRYTHFFAFVLPLFLLLFLAPVSEGATLYVDTDAVGANNGTSWANAFTSLQAALAASVDSDELWVAAGTYKPTAGADRDVSFVLKNNVALYGGFIGTENSRDQRNWTANVTILSGNIGNLATDADNSYHVVNGSAAATLDGFTITGGNANGALFEQKYGGGITISNASPTVTNCVFAQNKATAGGGMYNIDNSSTAVTGCTFRGNTANDGGGIYNFHSSPEVTDSTFSGNRGISGGGGIYNSGNSVPTVIGCLFAGNNAIKGAGMLNTSGSSPLINDSTFSNNSADFGGGMYNQTGGNPIITNSTFCINSARFGGGALHNDHSNPVVTNCTFSGNDSDDEGGALCNASGSNPVLMNCTFLGNSAHNGGGMCNDASAPLVTNTIFWGADVTAGQIYNQNAATPVITYSVTDQPGTGNIAGDPKLGPLTDNGGPSMTHALLDGSSALDIGTSTGAPVTDQRGIARPQGSGIDVGAYEKAAAASGGGSGGGCNLGFSPSVLLLVLPLLILTRR